MFSTNRWAAALIDRHPRLLTLGRGVAAGHAIVCIAVLGSTLSPAGPLIPDGLAIPISLVPVFPYWFAALAGAIAMASNANELSTRVSGLGMVRQVWRRAPRSLVVVGIVAFYGAWLIGALNIASLPGQPGVVNGRYQINDHGTITAIDRATYERALAFEERLFASAGLAFAAAGYVLLFAASSRESAQRKRSPSLNTHR
jgi:hypothetical protein